MACPLRLFASVPRTRGVTLRRGLKYSGAVAALGIIYSTAVWALPATQLAPVLHDLNFGLADSALQTLNADLAKNPSDAEAHNLRCRVYYEEQEWDQAIADCQTAVQEDPGNSMDHLWLGRAYGEKAARVSLMAGYKLAHKVAAEFQQAVQLDPHNVAALEDLGQFDAAAPAMAGGGYKRAAQVLTQLQAVNISAAHTLEGRLAEAHHDYRTAEAEFRAAIPQSPNPADAWMDLAAFYQRRGRLADMLTAATTGASLDKRHGTALVDGADVLIKAHADPALAIQWLRSYLSSRAQSEDAPSFAEHAKLASLLEAQGDMGGAEQQLAEARAEASGYRISFTVATNAGH